MLNFSLILLLVITLTLFSSSLLAEDEMFSDTITLDTLQVRKIRLPDDFPLNAPLNKEMFDLESIKKLGFTRVQDVAAYVPNYNLIDAGANGFADRSNIRGLTNTPVFTSPSVVLYVDDVPYLSSFAYGNQLVGVESIDVYRGPQGGLFGKNSYAGVINVKSRRPGNQLQGNVTVDNGNFDSLDVGSYLSGALVKDQLYFSMGSHYSKRDGYLNNSYIHSNEDFQDHLGGKVSLLWTPDTYWEIDLSGYLQDFNDGAIRAVSLLSDDIFQIQSGEQGSLDQDANGQTLKIKYSNEYFEALSITARRVTDTEYNVDFDFLPEPLFFQQSHLAQKQWSQEFRFKSLNESTWRWSSGLFFSDNAISGDQTNTVFSVFNELQLKEMDETTYAVFGQISYQGIDSLQIFLDLRLDYVEKTIDRNLRDIFGQKTQLNDNNNDLFVSPKLTLDYTFSSHINSYISTGMAFKPGGFSAQSDIFPEYKKETMWTNEMGINSNWWNNRFNIDLALFYYDIENYQLEEVFSPFDYTVINAPEVSSYGAELSFDAKIMETLQITGGFGYTQTEFNNYIDPFSKENFQGNKVPYVPMFNFNIASIFKHPSGFFAQADVIWTGKTYFDTANSDAISEQDYVLLNVIAGYESKYFNINAYANNLTNTQYFTSKSVRLNLATPGEPRTFGVKVGVKF